MRVPVSILAAANGLTDEELKGELAPPGPHIVAYTYNPKVHNVSVHGLTMNAQVRFEVSPVPNSQGQYAVLVTHNNGWALIKFPDRNGMPTARLWFAGRDATHAREAVKFPYPVSNFDLDRLRELTGLPEQTVRAALGEVGPFAHDSLRLMMWFARRYHNATYAEFRNDVLWLWHFLNYDQAQLALRLANNPVVGLESPNLRVVVYGCRCAALA